MRVQAPAADHVAAGRRHRRAAEPGQQRSRQQERGADPLGRVAVDRGLVGRVGGAEPQLVVAAPFRANAEPAQQREHELDVADARHVAQDDLVLGEDGGGEDGQRAVLVARGDDRPGQRHAAVDDELLHSGRRG